MTMKLLAKYPSLENERRTFSVAPVQVRFSGTKRSNLTDLSVRVTCGRGSVFLWRRCNTLSISGSVDDVTFSHNELHGDMSLPLQRRHCSVVNGLTPLLRGNWLCPAGRQD